SARSRCVVSSGARPEWWACHILWVASVRQKWVNSIIARTITIKSAVALLTRTSRQRGRGPGWRWPLPEESAGPEGKWGRSGGDLLIGVPHAKSREVRSKPGPGVTPALSIKPPDTRADENARRDRGRRGAGGRMCRT